MTFYLLVSAIAFLVLIYSVKKYTLNLDKKSLLEPIKTNIYPEFCDLINEKIRLLKTQLLNSEIELKNNTDKEYFLENLSNMSRKLNHIQTMNLSNKSDTIWQNELFLFLKELENLLIDFIQDGEKLSDELRMYLMNKFNELQKE
ncbi:hypothetical protein CINS5915_01520 [Campylobacter insulaenigrae]|uniref:Thioester dehydrase family protein n=2 Tax=Campylobacter insulaenigrae TaxID=260714 RepID=A0ABY3G536_9BACT|nr:hypothetical protein [Campylobacter insulaenigrae]AJC88126.1 putative membrane protein [Campylobacter insulaenigrae NCTC 12927]MCR6570710.1 hypothetical protein [Campylobacter insulaenigrae]MCR6572361.1 hypothetical protein [Campylobacter insulaenigrae]MCR6573885.1 hypothetical protein [Campylobacter insulaenigrae]MCR6575052.1 hypothetical protein [Campylobacter insulaenigrae]